MSTFFDPALIDTYANRITFMEEGITYLLGPVSVSQNTNKVNIQAYPNPATDVLSISFEEELNGTIELYNASGQVTAEQTANGKLVTIDVSGVSEGLYLIMLAQDGTTTALGKVMIKH